MVGLATYGLSLLLSRAPDLAERAYGSSLGPLVVRVMAPFTGWFSFSLGELLIVGYLLVLILSAGKAVRSVAARKRSLANALASGGLRLARDAGVLLTLFYFLWGFNYSRPSLEERLGWAPIDSVSVEEVAGLAQQLVLASNDEYRRIHGSDDGGTPTVLEAGRDSTVRSIASAWNTARISLGMEPRPPLHGKVKKLLVSWWYEWVGISGFYLPFTAEPNVRRGIPAVDVGKILAHEMAHQHGVAPEAEANFWGFLVAGMAPDPVPRYSAFVFAQGQLLSALARADRDRAVAIMELRIPGVRRDLEDSRDYWRRTFHRRGSRFGSAVNDAYLRSNQVSAGVRDYSRSAQLLIMYARARGGRIVP